MDCLRQIVRRLKRPFCWDAQPGLEIGPLTSFRKEEFPSFSADDVVHSHGLPLEDHIKVQTVQCPSDPAKMIRAQIRRLSANGFQPLSGHE
ncbi:hypothetical protein CNMCM5878_006235 [Aspergillus fumigatiaffinis]|nr:hypothetical protein CNMCM5878_006235 [Aspergillus fumigatiaffinis]